MEIYLITNIITKKAYVGMSKNSEKRFDKHKRNAISGVNRRLYDSMRKHGIENFKMEVIDFAETRDIAAEKERLWIASLGTLMPNGYNMTAGGDGGYTLSSWTEEEINALYRRQGLSRAGRVVSDETRNKISEKHKGKVISEEQRQKIRKTLLEKGISPPDKFKWCAGQVGAFTGRSHSEQTKRKLSEFRTGKSYYDLYNTEHAKDLIKRRRISFMGENNPKFVEFHNRDKIRVLYHIGNNFNFNIKDSKNVFGMSEYKIRSFLKDCGLSHFQTVKRENKHNWKEFIFDIILSNFKDVSELLGIQKWEPTIPLQLRGLAKGTFPSWVPKTDQERIQNLKSEFEEYKNELWQVTEKLHGSSCTFALDLDGNFEVCSRNLSLKFDENNAYWKAALKYDVERKMKETGLLGYAIQGEIIGEGLNGNQYKTDLEFYVFNIFSIHEGKYLAPSKAEEITKELDLKHVPVLEYSKVPNVALQELLVLAEGKSVLNGSNREGLVYKSIDGTKSFKVISNKWLLKNE